MSGNTYLRWISILALFIAGCHDTSEAPLPELVASWKLVEVYFDPGDGSGTFQPTEVDKILSFMADGTVTTTMSFCTSGEATDGVNSGSYDSAEMTITATCDTDSQMILRYEVIGDELFLSYPCREPCQEKYRRVLFLD